MGDWFFILVFAVGSSALTLEHYLDKKRQAERRRN